MQDSLKQWWQRGTPWIWLNAGAIAISMMMVIGLLGYIAYKGMVHFWPNAIVETQVTSPEGVSTLIGEIVDEEWVPAIRLRESGIELQTSDTLAKRYLFKTGNRDVLGMDFRWVVAEQLGELTYPEALITVERREWGNFYGYLVSFTRQGEEVGRGNEAWPLLAEHMHEVHRLHEAIKQIEKYDIGAVNYEMEKIRLKRRKYELEQVTDPAKYAELDARVAALNNEYEQLAARLAELKNQMAGDFIVMREMTGREVTIPLDRIVRVFQPNAMSLFGKIGHYGEKLHEFIFDDPREANTEGGIFPAIFGTVSMVFLMTLMVTPFGVVAAIYLREYATQGAITRLVRIAVNNLAGVPSIVYGVFGLGFFVYFLGGSIDELFFPEAAPSPVFGSPGLMWASLTLALLTVPVVIVATEEGLSRIPGAIKEGSLALGATKAETLWRVIIPMASPAIMTGMILAIARAAGEVAPLMLVGVVKLAPELPIDLNFPFVHLERKFMHLGFHIYDVGFQSPNVEAARPLVFATAFLLVLVIGALNLTAIMIRNRLREKYKALEH